MMGSSSQTQKEIMEKFTTKLRNIQETNIPIVKAAFKIYIGVKDDRHRFGKPFCYMK